MCDFSENANSILNLEFNHGPGDTVYDISGSGNHGTIYWATYIAETPEQDCSASNELSIIEQLNQSFDAWNVSITLQSAGWNIFGYGCPSLSSVSDGLSMYRDYCHYKG